MNVFTVRFVFFFFYSSPILLCSEQRYLEKLNKQQYNFIKSHLSIIQFFLFYMHKNIVVILMVTTFNTRLTLIFIK